MSLPWIKYKAQKVITHSLTHFTHSLTHFTHSLTFTMSRRSAAKSERDWYPHWLVPSGFSDTAFASRVSPRALRALRPAGFPHRRSITESERGSYPHRLVPSGFPDTTFASRVSPRALRALRPTGFHHTALTNAGLGVHGFRVASKPLCASRASARRVDLKTSTHQNYKIIFFYMIYQLLLS